MNERIPDPAPGRPKAGPSGPGAGDDREPPSPPFPERGLGGKHTDLLRELLAHATGDGHLPWRRLLKPGDWLLLVCAAALVAASYPLLWRGGVADRAIVRRDGQLVTELALNIPRKYAVAGAIGTTVIEVQPGRARVLSDPGPRQYCVQQGWLTRANAVAICAPNHVTLQLAGRSGQNGGYDTLNY